MENQVETLVKEFFEKLDISLDSIEVNSEEEHENIYNIKIMTQESGLLIGPHGKNLDAIQNILKLVCCQATGEKIKLHLEVNDYMKSKDDRLFDFIKSKISYVEKSGKDIKLPFYSAYERKKIHWYVSDYGNDSIFTKSIGEWKDRRLYICKQWEKLSIDIDGDDI